MAGSNHWRHELKYQITCADYLALRQRIRHVMKPDEHVREDGSYLIRSIYFDNYNDKALREKVDGVQQREKFRIRWYNDDQSYITLEKKVKHNSLCQKLDAQLTLEECRKLLQGRTTWMVDHPSPLVRELRYKMTLQQLRPRALISYLREPYVYAPGNVRVTFDYDIRTCVFCRDLLEAPPGINSTDGVGDIILEVKFDEFLPEVIASLLQAEGIRVQAFSKYGAGRRFG